jgi:ATP-binding cassette, subfamily B, bacterial
MNKIRETLVTLLSAARYSFRFCWKNARFDTATRLVIAVLNTTIAYMIIQIMGWIVDTVQDSAGKFKGNEHTFLEFISSDSAKPVLYLMMAIGLSVILGIFGWYFKNRWNQTLRYENHFQLNDLRARLDIARFRSKKYDDLERHISELPTSWQTRIYFSDEMLSLFTTTISFILFGATLITIAPKYALVLLVAALPMMIVEFKVVNMWWDLFQQMTPQHKKRRVLEKAYSNTTAFVQALMFQQMSPLKRDIRKNVSVVLDSHDKLRRSSAQKSMLTHAVAVCGLCGVVIHAVWNILHVGGNVGTLTVIIAASRTFQNNLEVMVSLVADQWNNAKGVLLIEEEFLRLEPFLQTPNPVKPDFTGAPLISFRDVSFTYPETEKEVLKGISFEIKPGSKVAIVGQSGNGKSSLVGLLMRHYDPTSGVITANGVDLRNIKPSDWADYITALTQDYSVMERTVAQEIASSRLDDPIDMEVLNESCRFAHFTEVVSSDSKGFDAQIGTEHGGREFSGGERQRLALARVHYRGSPILILDEPDAKLDPESAQKVIDHVFALKGVTVIMITHHVSRAERCNHIIMMGKGEIAEQGSHQELIAHEGVYATMFRKDQMRLKGSHPGKGQKETELLTLS